MRITITRPDDWHLHVRDGDVLAHVLAHTARRFARAIIMPNLSPPVVHVADAHAYRERILAALPGDARFEPLMTLYLTDATSPNEIERAGDAEFVHAVKLYPAGATTNSASGVTDMAHVYNVLEKMQRIGLPLLVHGEVTAPEIDVFDREKAFIDGSLTRLADEFPALRIVFEHITTLEAVQFVREARAGIAATITCHHLLHSRNAMFVGGLRPHYYCLPVLKRETHRQALIEAATSGNPRFFLGTDSAPHARQAKENACGCAGVYTAHAGIELYTEVFETAAALDKLQAFSSEHGADFYRVPRNHDTLTLERRSWSVPASYPFGDATVQPLRAGESVNWQIVETG
ncbi:MAG: dihydroorotase [Gammaproteobacteria bacterium]|nr:dihydroorotase [Gammaproteobacteria bacterium]